MDMHGKGTGAHDFGVWQQALICSVLPWVSDPRQPPAQVKVEGSQREIFLLVIFMYQRKHIHLRYSPKSPKHARTLNPGRVRRSSRTSSGDLH